MAAQGRTVRQFTEFGPTPSDEVGETDPEIKHLGVLLWP
jgi:hypothetical protein